MADLEWNLEAQAIHSLHLEFIIENGIDILKVAEQINDFVDGDDIYVDSHFDVQWLDLLFHSAKIKRNFKMMILPDLLPDDFYCHWAAIFHREQKKSGIALHNALNDAILIQKTYTLIASYF